MPVVAVLTVALDAHPEDPGLSHAPTPEVIHEVGNVEVQACPSPSVLKGVEVIIHSVAGQTPGWIVVWFSHDLKCALNRRLPFRDLSPRVLQ